MKLTLGSLFDGIGGWQLSSVRSGVEPLWSSEIEKFPLALTKERFPNTVQLGDVRKIDGSKIPPVSILCAGSPCQNLSVAGTRGGLQSGQSSLFIHSIRLIREMRRATNGEYPKFFVWENVPGAFTSGFDTSGNRQRGADFRTVLESIAETHIPLPKGGRWANAGLVQCPNCEIAWRTINADSWGVPQRRCRIFLIADFRKSKRCAGKILFIDPCLSGNTQPCNETGKKTPSNAEKSIRTASRIEQGCESAVVKIRSGKGEGTAGKGALIGIDKSFTLGCGNDQMLFQGKPVTNNGENDTVYDMHHAQDVIRTYKGKSPALISRMGTGENNVPILTETTPKSKIVMYDAPGIVTVRKNEVDIEGLKTLLKDALNNSGLSRKDIAEELGVPQTEVERWFRNDKYFSIPGADLWQSIKELLGITTDEFDAQVTEFVEEDCKYDSQNRIYDSAGIAPTLTSKNTDKTIIQRHYNAVYPLEGNGARKSHNGPGFSESETMFTLNTVERHAVAFCVQENMTDGEASEQNAETYSMSHDMRSARFTPNVTDPLTSTDYKEPPIVMQTSSTKNDQSAKSDCHYAGNSNGTDIAGSLCSHDGRGFNGQDVAQGKLVVEVYETDNDN